MAGARAHGKVDVFKRINLRLRLNMERIHMRLHGA